MSRKPKPGLDYAGWDIHIFEDDPKIDKLLDAQGWIGFAVYFYLCQRAYANGYFYRWSFTDSATTARKMAGGIRSETVKAAVGTCARVGLFDKRLLETEGILTSRGIQRGYVRGIEKRTFRLVDQRYWLLDEAETKAARISFLKSEPAAAGDSNADNADFLPENADFLPENGPNSILYNTIPDKEKKTRAREEAWGQLIPTLGEVKAYASEIQSNADPVSFYNYYAAADWHDRNGDPVRNWRQKFAVWNHTGSGYAPTRGNSKKSLTFYDVAERRKHNDG